MLVEGHPRRGFVGVYRKVSEHKGLPVFKKEDNGYCLYHFEAKRAWRLGGKHRPDEDLCVSHIASADGNLPTGAQTWLSDPHDAGPAPSSGHKEAVFSMTLLVCTLLLALKRCKRSFATRRAASLTASVVCARRRPTRRMRRKSAPTQSERRRSSLRPRRRPRS